MSKGCETSYGSNPPWINNLDPPCTTIACRYLPTEFIRCHSAVSVSYAYIVFKPSSGLLVLPPIITNLDPTKHTKCWYRQVGVKLSLQGGVFQSHSPFRCFTKPQTSFKAETFKSLCEPLWSFLLYLLPPKTTIMPVAFPY